MPTRKNRIISLRLSEEEYESLKSVYASRGVRSLSEFARDAMHRVVGGYPSSDTLVSCKMSLNRGLDSHAR
jgi:hypothetical protein